MHARREKSRSVRKQLSRATDKCLLEPLDGRRMFSTLTLTGTSGPDLITVDYSNGNFIYVINGGFAQLPAAGIDSIVINGLGGADTLQVERNNGIPTMVNGGTEDDTINISPVAKNLGNVTGSIYVASGAGNDVLNYRDDSNAGVQTYEVNNLDVRRGGIEIAEYGIDVERIVLTTGAAADTVNIPQTDLSTDVELNSAGGQDVLNVGSASNGLMSIRSDITVRNTPSFTTINLNDAGNLAGRNVAFNTTTIDGSDYGVVSGFTGIQGVTFRYKLADVQGPVNYVGGGGNDTFDILKTTTRSLNINGGIGNDTFRVGGASFNGVVSNIDAGLTLNGGTGVDQLDFRDSGQAAANSFNVTAANVSATLMASVGYSNFDNVTIYTGTALGGITQTVQSTVPGSWINFVDGTGVNNFRVLETAANSGVRLSGTSSLDNVRVNEDNTGSALLEFHGANLMNVGMLIVNDGGKVVVGAEQDGPATAGNLVLHTSLFMMGSGTLELQNHTLIDDWSAGALDPLNIRQNIFQGYAGGAWNGGGIQTNRGDATSFGLGFADSADLFGPGGGTIAGIPVDSTATIIRFTRYGDANLDRVVDIGDFARLASNFNTSGAVWSKGNFDYNLTTDIGDFSLLATNFNQALSGDLPRQAPLFSTTRIDPTETDADDTVVL